MQVNQSHCDSAEAAAGVCNVEIAANGGSFKASGSVQGGVPVLLELSDSTFRQPISLRGNLLFLQASANPQLLSSVAGKDININAAKLILCTMNLTLAKKKDNTANFKLPDVVTYCEEVLVCCRIVWKSVLAKLQSDIFFPTDVYLWLFLI